METYANKDNHDTKEKNSDAKEDNPLPCPQRKPRINRRNFHLSNHLFKELVTDKPEAEQNKSEVNGCDDSTENKSRPEPPSTENKSKPEPPKRKMISLVSLKNSCTAIRIDPSSTIIHLKKPSPSANVNSAATEVPSSDPPKKKHKPITWP